MPSKQIVGFDKFSAREKFASIFYNKVFKYPYKKNIVKRNLEIIKFALKFTFNNEDVKSKLPFLYSPNINIINQISKTKKI